MTSHRQNSLTIRLSILSMTMLWLSFPPMEWWWLAWFAPVPLIWLILEPRFALQTKNEARSASSFFVRLFGLPTSRRRFYWVLYFAGFAYWLATFYFIPFPHPALYAGWFAISLYLAIYTPLVVGASRVLIQRYRIPTLIAVPLVWTGFEWFRSNFATGMALVALSHSQFRHPEIIQVADLSGAYTLTFVMVLFATGIAFMALPRHLGRHSRLFNTNISDKEVRLAGLLLALLVIGGVLQYGQQRITGDLQFSNESLKVALIQSSHDVVFAELTAEEADRYDRQYRDLTYEALQWNPDLDLIIWPESGYRPFDLLSDFGEQYTLEDAAANVKQLYTDIASAKYPGIASSRPESDTAEVHMIVGGTTIDPERKEFFNSALWIAAPGKVRARYFKNHRVVLGEYVPFAEQFPFLESLTPIGPGMTAGRYFEVFDIKGLKLAPNICFESTVPHLIRRQVKTLNEQSRSPDVLVNLTNDGWFFGSSCLDLHLACNVFRAVELRKPMLVCANTGFSAYVDSRGTPVTLGPRRQPTSLIVDVRAERGLDSYYVKIGDTIPALFGALNLGILAIEFLLAAFRSPVQTQ